MSNLSYLVIMLLCGVGVVDAVYVVVWCGCYCVVLMLLCGVGVVDVVVRC